LEAAAGPENADRRSEWKLADRQFFAKIQYLFRL
jgi:hypothetical protein